RPTIFHRITQDAAALSDSRFHRITTSQIINTLTGSGMPSGKSAVARRVNTPLGLSQPTSLSPSIRTNPRRKADSARSVKKFPPHSSSNERRNALGFSARAKIDPFDSRRNAPLINPSRYTSYVEPRTVNTPFSRHHDTSISATGDAPSVTIKSHENQLFGVTSSI